MSHAWSFIISICLHPLASRKAMSVSVDYKMVLCVILFSHVRKGCLNICVSTCSWLEDMTNLTLLQLWEVLPKPTQHLEPGPPRERSRTPQEELYLCLLLCLSATIFLFWCWFITFAERLGFVFNVSIKRLLLLQFRFSHLATSPRAEVWLFSH